MRRWLLRHPFLTLGLATLLFFFVVESLRERGATEAAQLLAVPLRLLIVPMYLVWLLLTMLYITIGGLGPASAPLGVGWNLLRFTAGLAPYVAVDYLLQRWRHAKAQRRLAA